jgi:hypothetical protein
MTSRDRPHAKTAAGRWLRPGLFQSSLHIVVEQSSRCLEQGAYCHELIYASGGQLLKRAACLKLNEYPWNEIHSGWRLLRRNGAYLKLITNDRKLGHGEQITSKTTQWTRSA